MASSSWSRCQGPRMSLMPSPSLSPLRHLKSTVPEGGLRVERGRGVMVEGREREGRQSGWGGGGRYLEECWSKAGRGLHDTVEVAGQRGL
eukprot:2435599-Rhodomonas_salina.1